MPRESWSPKHSPPLAAVLGRVVGSRLAADWGKWVAEHKGGAQGFEKCCKRRKLEGLYRALTEEKESGAGRKGNGSAVWREGLKIT